MVIEVSYLLKGYLFALAEGGKASKMRVSMSCVFVTNSLSQSRPLVSYPDQIVSDFIIRSSWRITVVATCVNIGANRNARHVDCSVIGVSEKCAPRTHRDR